VPNSVGVTSTGAGIPGIPFNPKVFPTGRQSSRFFSKFSLFTGPFDPVQPGHPNDEQKRQLEEHGSLSQHLGTWGITIVFGAALHRQIAIPDECRALVLVSAARSDARC
jgi:hypothetical protein